MNHHRALEKGSSCAGLLAGRIGRFTKRSLGLAPCSQIHRNPMVATSASRFTEKSSRHLPFAVGALAR
jgi:hypothetical protein